MPINFKLVSETKTKILPARKADIPYKKPSVQTIAKIAKALNVSIEELIK